MIISAGSAEFIPNWYRFGMSRQIAVRLSDELVEFIDETVSAGKATSRAALVGDAVAREKRRQVAARDAAILSRTRQDDDFDSLAEYVARLHIDLD